jgi:cell volume regulation protein A
LVVRDGHSLRPHRFGRPQAGDQVYVITTPDYVGLLDQLFGGQTEGADDPRLYGEFLIDPATKIADLANAYGVKLLDSDEALTVAELLRRDLAGDIEKGDRVGYGPVDLIVRRVSDDHAIEEVGLALESLRRSRPRVPVFQSRKEIAEMLRKWWGRANSDAGGTLPPPDDEGKKGS